MKAGKGMSSDFMLEIGSGSLARLMSEWAHNKSWAETQSDEVESLRRQLDGLRRGLQQLIGAPDVPRLSDAELFTLLGEALDRAIDDRHVEYRARPDGPVELTVDVSALRVEPRAPFGEPFGDWKTRPPGKSPWLAPPQDTERPRPDHVDDQLTYAKMAERDEVTLTYAEDEGPPTESMPPVEEPPDVDPDYVLGRVFVRGDTIPDDVLGLATRFGDVWTADSVNMGTTQYWNDDADTWRSGADLLHMHGTLWELCNAAEQDSEQVSGE